MIEEDRPFGPNAECRQPSKNINAKAQQAMRKKKRLDELAIKHRKSVAAHNAIGDILRRNKAVEDELSGKTESGSFADATVADFLSLKPAQKLEDFIHVRKFNGKTFQKSQLAGSDGKLNKTCYKDQTAESIETDCSEENACLVWHAWNLRSSALVLKEKPMPVLSTSLPTPEFSVVYAGPEKTKLPSEYKFLCICSIVFVLYKPRKGTGEEDHCLILLLFSFVAEFICIILTRLPSFDNPSCFLSIHVRCTVRSNVECMKTQD